MPKFYFGFDTAEVKEGLAIECPILKEGSGRGSVWVCTSSQTGFNGAGEEDYEPVCELITFANSEDCKKVTVKAKADLIAEPDEYFRLQLLAVEANTIGIPNIMTIKIIDMPI